MVNVAKADSIAVEQVKISKSIIIKADMTWCAFIHGRKLSPSTLEAIPPTLNEENFDELVAVLGAAKVCSDVVETPLACVVRRGSYWIEKGMKLTKDTLSLIKISML